MGFEDPIPKPIPRVNQNIVRCRSYHLIDRKGAVNCVEYMRLCVPRLWNLRHLRGSRPCAERWNRPDLCVFCRTAWTPYPSLPCTLVCCTSSAGQLQGLTMALRADSRQSGTKERFGSSDSREDGRPLRGSGTSSGRLESGHTE